MTNLPVRPLPPGRSTSALAAGPATAPPAPWHAEPLSGPEGRADLDAADEEGAPGGTGTEPRGTWVVVRRVGPAAACTSSVEFPEHAGLGGLLRYLGNYPAVLYAVTDHLDRPVTPESGAERPEALNALLRAYGLPLPAKVIPRRPRGGAPALSASGAA
ncbi:hypothetical protein ABT093_19740 [Kitasatospora sp. NPDC002551]|uniref:hypothetical protein n=1 Tax=Kitasatospora sp. NPDC002551 TaxID=3154539 RepID=UPI0033289EC2